jgi:TolB-like protein
MAKNMANLLHRPVEPPSAERLDSWKEIAAYLKYSERTVRRWQREGLPVHRHPYRKRGGVYAYKPEIDAWWNDGHARLVELERAEAEEKRTRPRWLVAARVALLLLLAGSYLARKGFSPRPRPPAGKIMFAVLPFENLSKDPEQEYFSDGLTEEMISRLGQLEPHRLGVIGRTSAIQYKGTKKRIDQIGKELGVDYILEGTVRHAGDRVRVSAQLIQVSDQTHIWAKNYERDLRDILVLQEDVAQAIASEVEIRLTPEQQSHLMSAAQVNTAAYDAYLKGRYYLTRISGRDLQKALDYFKQATAIDPHYALGYASLAETYNDMNTAYLAPVEAGPKAKAAAVKALQLDETLALAHAALGKVRLLYDWDWPGAEKEFLRSLELNPNLPEAHLAYAEYLATIKRFQESIEHVRIAYALDPFSTSVRFKGIRNLRVSRRYEEALEECRKVRELPPDFTEPFHEEAFAYARLGRFREAAEAAEETVRHSRGPLDLASAAQAYAEAGNKEEATKLLRQILAGAQTQFVCGLNIATIYTALGDADRAFYWLREGIAQRSL